VGVRGRGIADWRIMGRGSRGSVTRDHGTRITRISTL
jgi:hypothetical protein